MLQQLEQNKPHVKPPVYYNIPLIIFLTILGLGLSIVGLSVVDSSKTSFIVKILGPMMVLVGMFSVLVRIAFTNMPSFLAENSLSDPKKNHLRDKQSTVNSISEKLKD